MRYRFAGKRNLHHAARHLTERNADFLPAEGRVQGIAIRTAYCQHAGTADRQAEGHIGCGAELEGENQPVSGTAVPQMDIRRPQFCLIPVPREARRKGDLPVGQIGTVTEQPFDQTAAAERCAFAADVGRHFAVKPEMPGWCR